MSARAYIGTSGFTYPHWKGVFYPPEAPQRRWLEHYAEHFDTVELNNTFYSMPRPGVCEGWRRRTPEGFRFVVKMNRLVTHRKRLIGCGDLVRSFLEAVGRMEDKLGPILVQLPPHWQADCPRLEEFLGEFPEGLRVAVEFRDPSWLCEAVYGVLRRRRAALVVHDHIEDHPRVVTADFVYLRYHGTRGHAGCYSPQFLTAEAGRIRSHLGDGLDVYAYFNNDVRGHAVHNAADLRRHVGR